MYPMYNAGHSVVCQRFIRTLQKKLYKCMISISKKLYINKFDEIVNKYNNAYHKTVKMKLIDVKSSKYNDLNKKNNKEDPIFEVGDHVRISKYKIFFQKVAFQIGLKNLLRLKKLEMLCRGHMLLRNCWDVLRK